MIYAVIYSGQTKPCICFDDYQAKKAIAWLRAANKAFIINKVEASGAAVEQLRQRLRVGQAVRTN